MAGKTIELTNDPGADANERHVHLTDIYPNPWVSDVSESYRRLSGRNHFSGLRVTTEDHAVDRCDQGEIAHCRLRGTESRLSSGDLCLRALNSLYARSLSQQSELLLCRVTRARGFTRSSLRSVELLPRNCTSPVQCSCTSRVGGGSCCFRLCGTKFSRCAGDLGSAVSVLSFQEPGTGEADLRGALGDLSGRAWLGKYCQRIAHMHRVAVINANVYDPPRGKRSHIHLDDFESSGRDDRGPVSAVTSGKEKQKQQHDAVKFHACTKRQRR